MPKEHKIIKGFVFRLVKKRIAGLTLSSVLQEVRENEGADLHTTVTFLNDSVDDATKARYNANAYVQLAKQVSRLHLNADVSLRLSQLGMNLNNDVLDMCMDDLLKAVKNTNTRIWFESELNVSPAELLGLYRKSRAQYGNIGVEIPIGYNLEVATIKRFLKPNDMVKLTSFSHPSVMLQGEIENGAHKRKGREKNGKKEKKEKSSAAQRKFILEHYLADIGKLLQADVGIAVYEHDEKLISKLAGFSREYKKNLIFELPLGFSARKINRLQKQKINLSVYTPYGKDWTSYVMNRLTVGHGRIRSIAARVLEGQKSDEYEE